MTTTAISLTLAITSSMLAFLSVILQPFISANLMKEMHHERLAKLAWFDKKPGAKGRAAIERNKSNIARSRKRRAQMILLITPLLLAYCFFLLITN